LSETAIHASILVLASWVPGRLGTDSQQQSRSILKPSYLGIPCADQPREETEGCIQQSSIECQSQWSPPVQCDISFCGAQTYQHHTKLLDGEALRSCQFGANALLQHGRVSRHQVSHLAPWRSYLHANVVLPVGTSKSQGEVSTFTLNSDTGKKRSYSERATWRYPRDSCSEEHFGISRSWSSSLPTTATRQPSRPHEPVHDNCRRGLVR